MANHLISCKLIEGPDRTSQYIILGFAQVQKMFYQIHLQYFGWVAQFGRAKITKSIATFILQRV